MSYTRHLLVSAIRAIKKAGTKPNFLNFYERPLQIDKPTICLTHDIDVGHEPHINDIIDLEKKYNVESTFFLLETSLPSKNWIQQHSNLDLQFHANFVSKNDFLEDKKKIDNLIGRPTIITRSHKYVLPSLDTISNHFKADASYNNFTNLTLYRPFLLKQELVEFPTFPEVPFTNLKKETALKLLKGILQHTKRVNGLMTIVFHPFLFHKYGKEAEELILTQDGFEFLTLSNALKQLR